MNLYTMVDRIYHELLKEASINTDICFSNLYFDGVDTIEVQVHIDSSDTTDVYLCFAHIEKNLYYSFYGNYNGKSYGSGIVRFGIVRHLVEHLEDVIRDAVIADEDLEV